MNDTRRPDHADALDETIEESFPASDPPANTGETGIRIMVDSAPSPVIDHRAASRFELVKDGEVAFLTYTRMGDSITFLHTEVPPALRGRHLADELARAGLAAARADGLRVVAVCPFVQAYLRKHPQGT